MSFARAITKYSTLRLFFPLPRTFVSRSSGKWDHWKFLSERERIDRELSIEKPKTPEIAFYRGLALMELCGEKYFSDAILEFERAAEMDENYGYKCNIKIKEIKTAMKYPVTINPKYLEEDLKKSEEIHKTFSSY